MKHWPAHVHRMTMGIIVAVTIGLLSAMTGIVAVDAATNPAHTLFTHPLVAYWRCEFIVGFRQYEPLCQGVFSPPRPAQRCAWSGHSR